MLVPSLRGLTKTAKFKHGIDDLARRSGLTTVQMQALIGAAGGGVLGAGAGYLLSDEEKKKRGMLAGGLVGTGMGGLGGAAIGALMKPRFPGHQPYMMG